MSRFVMSRPFFSNTSRPTSMSHRHHHEHGIDAHESSDSPIMSMMTHFYFGMKQEVLFEGWIPSGPWASLQYFLLCCMVFFLAVGREYLAYYRSKVLRIDRAKLSQRNLTGDDLPLMENSPYSSKGAVNFDALTRFKHALIYAAGFVVSYLLMLVVMTFNAGYFIVMATGTLMGHFWFPNDASDCH